VFLRRVVADLQRWLDSRWTAGLLPFRHGLVPELKVVCASGDGPGTQCPEIVCPIQAKAQQGLTALVAIGPKLDGTRYTASDRELAEDLCGHVGRLLSHERAARNLLDELAEAERVKEEAGILRGIYDRLDHLGPPQIPGLEFNGECQRGGAPGGDFFELLPHGERELLFAIGNVAPYGIPGSLMLGSAIASIRALAGRDAALSEITAELNRLLWELSPENAYSSSFCAGIDPAKRQLRYVNAGHEPALLLRLRTGRVERLESTGAILGLTRRSAYRERTLSFEPGDLLLAFSDGVSESVAHEQLLRLLREARDFSVQELTDQLLRAPAGHDRTVVAVRSSDSFDEGIAVRRDARFPSLACAPAAA
jgi:sigma-B regulation protein RsbU (phosphoserine phosphatase)